MSGPGAVATGWLDRLRTSGLEAVAGPPLFRALALANALVLVGASVYVLREVTLVVGGTRSLLTIVAVALLAATVAAFVVGPRIATVGAIGAAVAGFAYYLSVAGVGPGLLLSATGELTADTITLIMGLSLLRLTEVGTWTLGFAPAPAFLTWYLVLRRWYAPAVVPGGLALLFLVLTGDASMGVTVVGTIAGIAVVGFGELERRDGTLAQVDVMAVLFAAMLILSLSVSVIPGGTAGGGAFGGDAADGSLEGAVAASPDESPIGGSVELSPEVRFTVQSEQPAYWRTGVYDRFTGDEWVRSGQPRPYGGPLAEPPGSTETVRHVVTVHGAAEVMPTAAQPVAVEGDARTNTLVTEHGQFRPASTLLEGDAYTVQSEVPTARPGELHTAGTSYPDHVEERYLQLPSGTSSAFEDSVSEVTEDAETPYEKAVAIERHLRSEKGYSLDVDRPDGNVAEAFLFEMDEGYCVYFATAMTQMLRAEDVPARYVTGYTAGEQVDDDQWVVRGLDAHAWVEVYFPGHGWVEFEPTPPDTRDDRHGEELEEARAEDVPGVDTEDSADLADDEDENDDPDDGDGVPDDPTDENETDDPNDVTGVPDEPTDENETDDAADGTDPPDDDGSVTDAFDDLSPGDWIAFPSGVPSTTLLVPVAILLAGLAAMARRVGAGRGLRRAVGIYWHGRRRGPDADVARAYRRLEWSLERRFRPRDPSETARQYVASIGDGDATPDPRVREVLDRYERVVYGGVDVDRETAEETIATVDRLTRGRLPVVGRRWR